MVSAKPLTTGLDQSTDFLNSPEAVHMLDQTIRLIVDYWFGPVH